MSLGNKSETPSQKKKKISQAWWHAPVIPAIQEAEAGELLNLGGRGCSEPRSHHCTPAWVTEQDSVSKKKKKKKPRIQSPQNPTWAPNGCHPRGLEEVGNQEGRASDLPGTTVQHFGGQRQVDHLRPGVGDQPNEHSETLSLLKIQKLGRVQWLLPVIQALWEAEEGDPPASASQSSRITGVSHRAWQQTTSEHGITKKQTKKNAKKPCPPEIPDSPLLPEGGGRVMLGPQGSPFSPPQESSALDRITGQGEAQRPPASLKITQQRKAAAARGPTLGCKRGSLAGDLSTQTCSTARSVLLLCSLGVAPGSQTFAP
ncbi:putative uncharacterized protein C8orf49 [Plecturocebus cupreus]